VFVCKWLLFFDQSQSHQLFENQQYSVAQAPEWHRNQTVMFYVGKKVNSRKIKPIKLHTICMAFWQHHKKINPECCKILNLINQLGTLPQTISSSINTKNCKWLNRKFQKIISNTWSMIHTTHAIILVTFLQTVMDVLPVLCNSKSFCSPLTLSHQAATTYDAQCAFKSA